MNIELNLLTMNSRKRLIEVIFRPSSMEPGFYRVTQIKHAATISLSFYERVVKVGTELPENIVDRLARHPEFVVTVSSR